MESENKKPRLDGPIIAATSSRRSQRQRRVRGEKEIIVSCDQTLLDLKREVLFLLSFYTNFKTLNRSK